MKLSSSVKNKISSMEPQGWHDSNAAPETSSSTFLQGGHEYVKLLSRADRVRNCLSQLKKTDPLSSQTPTFVVVGMQTVGKSSVLSRISGVKFPADSKLCTRCPAELRMRNCAHEAQSSVKITAQLESGEMELIAENPSEEEMSEKIREAQDKARGDLQVSEKGCIIIEVTNPNVPVVTLVDLPGIYHAKDNSPEETHYATQVRNLVKEKTENENTLILHVLDVSMDTGNDATWKMVNDVDENRKRTISVATKADLQQTGPTQLEYVRDKCEEKGNSIFVIKGNAASAEEEYDKLSILEAASESNVQIGISKLKDHLQFRMRELLEEKLPLLRTAVEDEIVQTKRDLHDVGFQPPEPRIVAVEQIKKVSDRLNKFQKGQVANGVYNKRIVDFKQAVEQIGKEITKGNILTPMTNVFSIMQNFPGPPQGFQPRYPVLQQFLAWIVKELEPVVDEFISDLHDFLLKNLFLRAVIAKGDTMCEKVQHSYVKPEVERKLKEELATCKSRAKEALEWQTMPDPHSTNEHYYGDNVRKLRNGVNTQVSEWEARKAGTEYYKGKTWETVILKKFVEGIEKDGINESLVEGSGEEQATAHSKVAAQQPEKGEETSQEDEENSDGFLSEDSDEAHPQTYKQLAEDKKHEVLDVWIHVRAYWKVQRKLLVDVIQNQARQFLLYKGIDDVKDAQERMTLEHTDKIGESERQKQRRERLKTKLQQLKEAYEILSE